MQARLMMNKTMNNCKTNITRKTNTKIVNSKSEMKSLVKHKHYMEFKSYLDKYCIRSYHIEALIVLERVYPILFEEGLQNTLKKQAKKNGITERALFSELHLILNNIELFDKTNILYSAKNGKIKDLCLFSKKVITVLNKTKIKVKHEKTKL